MTGTPYIYTGPIGEKPVEPPFEYPADFVKAGNCGLVALSIATGTPLAQVTEWFRVKENRRGNWQGGTHPSNYNAFLQSVGVWPVFHRYNTKERVRTVGDFCEWKAADSRFFIVGVTKHVVLVKGGWICDQNELAPANLHWCRNKRVMESWEILP